MAHIPESVDFERMCAERHQRLQSELAERGLDAALFLHAPHVTYATGQPVRGCDVSHASAEAALAVVVAGQDRPMLLAEQTEGLPVDAGPEVRPLLDEDMDLLQSVLSEVAGADARWAVDLWTGPMLRAGVLAGADDASALVAAAKRLKTADEVACIDEAQRLNNLAMADAYAAFTPGATRGDVAGAFLGGLRRVGVEANLIDPIFQVMPRDRADGPRTTNGSVAFPTGVGNPTYEEGDLIWNDSGVDVAGYASDFGRTWICGRDPDDAEQDLFARWMQVMHAVYEQLRPGTTGTELCAAAIEANGGDKPWLDHFYLFHGIGIESAEFPMAGTDAGPDADAAVVLEEGMVFVLEPVVWVDGTGGYRAEEIVAITADGYQLLGGGHPYAPFHT